MVVLLSDDDPAVRHSAALIPEKKVLPTCDAVEALQLCENRHVDLLLTGVQMKGMTGIELIQHVVDHKPETKVLLMSGFPEADVMAAGLSVSFKTFHTGTLTERLREVLRMTAESACISQKRKLG